MAEQAQAAATAAETTSTAATGAQAAPDSKPEDAQTKQERREERQKLFQALLAEVAQLKHQLPGMVTRIASEQLEKRVNNRSQEENRIQKPDLQAQLDALSTELKKRDEIIAAERRVNSIRAAVSSISWFNPEDAVREILPVAQERDGKLYVPGVERVANQEISREYSIDEAVAKLAKSKPYLVKASVQSGSGATGGSSGSAGVPGLKTQITKWGQVKDNPVLLASLQAEDPAYAEQLQFKYIEKQRRKAAK